MNKKLLVLLIAGLAACNVYAEGDNDAAHPGVKQDIKDGAHAVKEGTVDAAHAVEHGTVEAAHAVKHGTKTAWHSTKNGYHHVKAKVHHSVQGSGSDRPAPVVEHSANRPEGEPAR
jgi:hypothetical protein